MTTPAYAPQTWTNGPGGGTPINAARLLHMETGIANAEETLVSTGPKTASYTAGANDFVPADMSASAWAIQLPTAPPNGTTIAAMVIAAGNTLTINRGGTDVFYKVGGPASLALSKLNRVVWLEYYSGIWYVTNDSYPPDFVGVQATVSGNGTAVEANHNPFDATAAVRTVTLPTPSGPGRFISIEKVDASANAVNVTGTIDGVGSTTHAILSQNETMCFISSATSWWRLANYRSKAALDALYTVGTRITSASISANFTTTSTTAVDVPSLSVTFTAVAGQTYEIKIKAFLNNTVAGDATTMQLTDSANTVLDSGGPTPRTAGDAFEYIFQTDVSPAAGSVTYKARLLTASGGTATVVASSTAKALMTVTRVA